MKRKMAIFWLRTLKDRKEWERKECGADKHSEKYIEALDTAIEALKNMPEYDRLAELIEREKPKRPNRDWNEARSWYECPCCEAVVDDWYCAACGQRIDWPEEEEE